MARSNGQIPVPPPPHGDAQPQWRHPAEAAAQGYPQPGFAPPPELPPFGHQPPQDPFAQPPFQAHAPAGQPAWTAHAQHHAQAQHPQAHQGHAPQQGYDLGHYGHAAPAPQPVAQPLSHDPYGRAPPPWAGAQSVQAPPLQQGFDPAFAAPQSFAEPVTSQRAAAAAYPAMAAASPMAAMAAAPAMRGPQQAPSAPVQADGYEDDYEEEFEDEPKRGRKLMVVGALVGAICVGGGLAYAYKAFSGGKTPLINAQKAAPKVAPVAAKLPEAVPTQTASAPSEDGPRRVQTISVTPPGGTATPPPTPAPPPGQAVMPGMVLDNFPRAPVASAVAPAQAVPQPQPTAPLRPSAPATAPAAAQPQPKVAVVNPPQAPVTPPAPERKAAPVPKKAQDAYNPSAAAGAAGGVTAVAAVPPPPAPAAKSSLGAAPSGGANGFVATVLSTQKGRPEAMKAFADLQQKYPDVLGAKPAEVQEKDLGEKGKWFRAVVGPPGSRDAASQVCTQLKASGYGQCFVTAY